MQDNPKPQAVEVTLEELVSAIQRATGSDDAATCAVLRAMLNEDLIHFVSTETAWAA